MLQIKNLTITHRKDLRIILEDFNLTLNDGDKAVIIGEEGNGKSTLMKWIYNPELAEEYTECIGACIIGNEVLSYLPQELPEEDKNKTLYEYFSESEHFLNNTPRELSELAGRFNMSSSVFYSDQVMASLSGGEKVKAQLMRILINKPTVLLLDEPSNDIDISTLELLEKFINEWDRIILFISHDETLIENTANVIIHLEQIIRKTKSRYTVARDNYRHYIERRAEAFERQEQQALSDKREKELRDEKYRKILQKVDKSQLSIRNAGKDLADKMQAGRNLKDKMHTVKSMGRRFAKEDENMTEMPEQEEAIFFKLGG
ncbi:MAG: ABC-F family ATP-binding cassette domain-containing protein, partial [Lachnospiraceae bacterium]|nr:ABC-F family ATP-binding cassette domain-containing protein [Lachnospiraceae bacterium]